jgi:hypothetical protein
MSTSGGRQLVQFVRGLRATEYNTFISSKFIVLCMFDLHFITVA